MALKFGAGDGNFLMGKLADARVSPAQRKDTKRFLMPIEVLIRIISAVVLFLAWAWNPFARISRFGIGRSLNSHLVISVPYPLSLRESPNFVVLHLGRDGYETT